MGSLKIILLLIFTCLQFTAKAYGDTSWHLTQINFIEGNYADFNVDNLNNIYLINNNSSIKKLNDSGDSVAVFNNIRKYGNVFTLDVTNPLKILLYYKDFSTIIILDRFLNAVNTIDLRQKGILQAKAVAISYDNNYWVFDELNNTLKKLGNNSNLLLETSDFRTLFSEPFNPDRIIDNNGLLYLYDINSGWRIFDYYGAFKQYIPAASWQDVQVANKVLSGHDKKKFYQTTPETILIKSYEHFDSGGFIKAIWQTNKLYMLKNNGLAIFTVQ